MSDTSRKSDSARQLPVHPSLEHLKREAKQRLAALRATSPEAKLSDAQFSLARDYGFASWRALKAEVDRRGHEASGASTPADYSRYVGCYAYDPAVITNSVITVGVDAGRLWLQTNAGSKLRLIDQGDGSFGLPGLSRRYRFEGEDAGRAGRLVIDGDRDPARLERTNPEAVRDAQAACDRALAEQARTRTPITVGPEVLDRHLGHFANGWLALEVTRDGDELFAQIVAQPKFRIFPETETDFFVPGAPIQLSFLVEEGRTVAVIVHLAGHDRHLQRVSAKVAEASTASVEQKAAEQRRPRAVAEIDPRLLGGYVGRYLMDTPPRTRTRTVTVTADASQLFIELFGQPRYEVYPESDHKFFWTVAAAQISFVTDESGRAQHAILHQHGRDTVLIRADEPPYKARTTP